MAEEKKDFKEVKVKIQGGSKEHADTLDRTMLYSGVNIFGTLTNLYLSSKEQFQSASLSQSSSSTPLSQPVGTQSEALSGASANSMMQLGNDVLSIFKKMQKRDSITKIKAFQELKKYVETIDADSEELPNILTFFLYHMCRILLNENDKLVREAAHDSFTSFIRKAKRKLGPHIKKIFPLWYCAFFDASPEVVRLARSNFELAFPVEKQPEVFQISYKMFLHFAHEQLQQSGDDGATGQDKKSNEEIFDRVTCSVLQALANSFEFIKKWSVEDQKNYQRKLLDILQLNPDQQSQVPTVKCKGGKSKTSLLWNFLQPKYRGSIKGACLQFVAAFITEMPAEIVQSHIKDLTPAVLSLVSEQNPILQTTFWREALFTLAKNFPDCWASITIKKDFLPKLYLCLKDAAFGAPQSLYDNFVKFFSVCPLYKLTDFAQTEDKNNKASFKDRCNLIREVMLNLYTAMQNDEAVAFHTDLINSYCESLTFILLKRIQNVEAGPDQEFAMKQMEKVIQTPLLDFVNNYAKLQSKHQKARNLRSSFTVRYCKMLVDLADRDFDPILFKQVCEMISSEFNPSKRNAMRLLSQIVEQFKNVSEKYREIINTDIIAVAFNKQTKVITNFIADLSKANIEDCTQMVFCHRRLVYTLVKKQILQNDTQLQLLQFGEMLTTVLKKEKMARNVLSSELLNKFKDLKQFLVDIAVLYLTKRFDAEEEFRKILLSVGLLEVSTEEASQVKMDPLEQAIFQPDFSKISLAQYFEILRTSAEIHDLMVGAISIKMLAENSIVEYQRIVGKVIEDSVNQKPTAILNEEDLELIRTQVIEQLLNPDIPIQCTTAYYQSVEALCVKPDLENDEFRQILIIKLLEMRIDSRKIEQNYEQIWNVFAASVQNNSEYQAVVTQKLQEGVSQMIMQQSDISSFNHITRVIGAFVQLKKNKVETLAKILLKEHNFARLDTNCLPLKMFKDLFLQGGVGFDVQELLCRTLNGKYQYVWLASTFLSIKHLTSLSSLMELKRQLMIFVETEVIQAIINLASSDEHRQFVLEIFQYLNHSGQIHTFELLAKNMSDPGDQYPDNLRPVLRVDDFKQIFKLTVNEQSEKIIEENFAGSTKLDFLVVVLQTIGYFILDEPIIKKLFNIVRVNLQTPELSKLPQCKAQLEIYMALEKWLIEKGDQQTHQFQVQLLNELLKLDSIEMKQIAISLCNTLLERQSSGAIKSQTNTNDLLLTILELLEYTGDVACQNTITLCRVIRKTLDWSQASDSIISVLIQQTKDRAEQFDNALKNVGGQTGSSVRQFEIEMLQELAETLLVFPLTLNQSTMQPSIEENLYFLLGCSFEALQKAAYVLLKFIYDNFVPPVEFISNEEDDLKNLMNIAVEEQKVQVHSTAFKNISPSLLRLIDEAPSTDDEQNEQLKADVFSLKDELESLVYGASEEGQMNNKVFGYLLAWNAMLSKIEQGRIKAQLSNETNGQSQAIQYLQVLSALTEYLETDSTTYHMMLVSLVPYLPKISKKGAQESYQQELNNFSPEYCNPRDPKHTRMLCLMSLINFMKSFPSLGRKFYQECDRQLLEVMLPYIKSVISPAILENEIKKIEMSQIELGANSDLTFVLFKSTKEVIATYAKTTEISCQLKIKIPHDYPLKSVQVDIGEQLKLKQTQIRKWTLSIRNLLQSRNGDIISAILLWKNNIDKEMQGIEECFICYSVMHQTDKSLPSMQCKNCKNKFHVACIRKWFNTSNKSNCPLCQTFFFQ